MAPDNVYDKCVLEVRIVDWPIVMKAVTMVVEDMNGQVEKLGIYNWTHESMGPLLKTFQPNRKLHIINPHLRIAMDGQRIIRVEDPCYVMMGEAPSKCCHCCGELLTGGPMKCSKCRMALYCSKECQTHDWSELKHKLVCKHLAKYVSEVFDGI